MSVGILFFGAWASVGRGVLSVNGMYSFSASVTRGLLSPSAATATVIRRPVTDELAAGRDSDEHRRVTVLGDADGRGSLHSLSCHVPPRRG